jgi:hypothetical protein
VTYYVDLTDNTHEVILSTLFRSANSNCPLTSYVIKTGDQADQVPTAEQTIIFSVSDFSTGKLTINSSSKGMHEFWLIATNMHNTAAIKVSLTISPCKQGVVSLSAPVSYRKEKYFNREVRGT